jgi:hypothetical protein
LKIPHAWQKDESNKPEHQKEKFIAQAEGLRKFYRIVVGDERNTGGVEAAK